MSASARRIRTLAVCLTITAVSAVPAVGQASRPPTVDDILDLVQVSSPQISPDGSRVLFTQSEILGWKDNKRVSSIWIAHADGSDRFQFLGSGKDRSPRWSPDGAHVAFLSTRQSGEKDSSEERKDEDEAPQIWLLRAHGGEAWTLTDHKGRIKSFEWSGDGSQIFFLSEDAKTDEEKAAEKTGDDAIYVDEGPSGQERGRYTRLWSVTVSDRRERKITREPLLIGAFAASPDARAIAVHYRRENTRNGQYRSEIAVVDLASGAMRDVTKNDAPESGVTWSPDGKTLSFEAPSDRSWELAQDKLYLVPAAGGAPRRISDAFPGDIERHFWTPDGRAICFAGMSRGRGGVFQIEVATGRVKPISATGDLVLSLDSVSADLTRAAGVLTSPASPGDVYAIDLTSGQATRVTSANPQVDRLTLAQVRPITWKSADGLEVEGLLWLPAGSTPGSRLPLVVSVHGGPAGVWQTSFRGINHVYAGLGWAVIEPNVRGSTSYGDAFLRGNMKDIGGGDFRDLMTGVDALVARGLVDPDRLAIRGWSYGGILGGWTITQTTRFKAASLGAMVSDWASEYATGFNHDVRLWYIGGTPWDNADGYRRQSAYTHIARVTTATLIIHGERDTTDTVGQSMIFYQGLKDRGVTTRFIRFPREPHGFGEPHHQRIRDVEEIAWLMKHARGIDWKAPERKDQDERGKTSPNQPEAGGGKQ